MPAQSGDPRQTSVTVDPEFTERWSPRSFLPGPLAQGQIDSLFEAARWAPSASNFQPWLFLYETEGPGREVFNSILSDNNRRWALKAPLLIFVIARKVDETGRTRRTAVFDAGAAWMSLALQARKLGLFAHAMAGINLDAAHEKLCVPRDTHEVICAVAVGAKGETSALPEDLQAREKPNARKPLAEVARRGLFVVGE